MQNATRLKYNFAEESCITSILLASYIGFIIWMLKAPIVISLLIFCIIYWLFYSLLFFRYRLTSNSILGIKYLKPFQKKIKYSYEDIKEVTIAPYKNGKRLIIKFKTNKRLVLSCVYDTVELIQFFNSRNIKIITNTSEGYSYLKKLFLKDLKNEERRHERKSKRMKKNKH